MNPSGLHANKPLLAAIGIGVVVVVYVWFKYSTPSTTVELEMDAVEQAKLNVDSVEIRPDMKKTFKVGDKDVTIAYREAKPSSKPDLDILLLHGMRFKSETWATEPVKTLQLLSTLNYRAVAIDLPGFGNSPKVDVDRAEFMAAVISALELDKPVIVSPSMSGSYALPYLLTDAKTAEERCQGYVPVAPGDTDKYTDATYNNFKVPTLIIYGAEDTNIGQTSLQNLQKIPNKTIVKLPDAGHACYLDKPDEFHKNLHSFLKSLKK